MKLLGIGITGLEAKFPDELQIEPDPIMGKDEEIVVNKNAYSAFTEEERASFKKRVQPLIEENLAIPYTMSCPIPESVINIETPEGGVAFVPQYRIAERMIPVMTAQVKTWEEHDVIEEAEKDVAFNIPLTCAPKADGSARICADARPINRISQEDKYPLLRVEDVLAAIKGSKVFSKIDCKDAYHSLLVAEKDRHKLTFTWAGKCWRFKKAPFGLKQIPSKFMRTMFIIFSDYDTFIVYYMDDIIVFSMTAELHAEHISTCIRLLTKNAFRINMKK